MNENSFLNDLLNRSNFNGRSDAILDSLPVGVEIYAMDGTLLYLNRTDARIFNVDRQTLIASGVNLFDNPNLPHEVKEALQNCREVHTRFLYDFNLAVEKNYYETSNRKTIQIECNGRPIFGANGKAESYVFIVEDVTEKVRKEEELSHSKRKTDLAIRDSGIMLWEFDVLRKEFYSDNEPMNAYDRTSPISVELYSETIHPENKDAANETIERMSAGEDFSFSFDARILFPGNAEWQYCTVNGSPYEYDGHGRVAKYVGTRKNNTDLQKKELLQEKILNNIPLPILIKDVENNFRYVFCNEESKRMLGTSEEKTSYDVLDARQAVRVEKTDKEVFATGKPYFGHERIVLKDGRTYDTIVRKSIIYDGGRRLLLNIRWDQSLQNELERRAKLLSISMEEMDAYSWFFIPGENNVSFGEGFDRVGRSRLHLNTLEKFVKAIHPDDQSIFTGSIDKILEKESGRLDAEYRVDLNGSGEYEWWRTRGLLETTMRDEVPYKYMYGMSININTHKETELTLLRNKEELNNLIIQNELVLNNTNSGLAYITTDFIVQWENISLCSKSLSYEAYRKGEPCYQSAHGRTEPCENCVMQRAIQSKQLEQIKFNLNNEHILEVFATPVLEKEKVVGIVIRIDDVTERERIIEKLQLAQAQAEQSDKLKSAFLANMSHEIRTPLNAIVGFSDLLINTPDSEDREEYKRIINNNNELLLKLINDILDLSKIESGSVDLEYEEFDLAIYFDGMVSSMKQRITHPNVRLVAVNPYKSCNVLLDKNRLAQIMTNYVTNAIKYTPKGFIEMGYECMSDGIRFYVRDSGIGIPEEKKSKVFHRFEKLDEFAQGTGLGLSICNALAESMGGKVGFESQFGEGSLFWAFLPCKPETDSCRETKDSEEPGFPEAFQTFAPETKNVKREQRKKHKILIAEDIPSNYLLVSSLLKERYDLIHAVNGKEAVDLTGNCHPDLVLMDMKMPVMDGMKATEEIRRFDPSVPIIALTAHAFDADRQAALASGCSAYLVKPVNKKELMDMLEKYCIPSTPSV